MTKPRVIASIEARMGSSRLPGKVLMEIGGQVSLARMVHRLQGAAQLDGIIIATSTAPGDDAIASWAQDAGLPCFRGSEDDVLQRVVDAHAFMQSDVIVEITGDCPLIDAALVDLAVETFFANSCDVVSSAHSGTWPSGTDVQVFRNNDLAEVARTIHDPAVREHVSLHFYETPERYRVVHMLAPHRYRLPNLRLDLDYPEDLEFITAIYAELEPQFGPRFDLNAILDLLQAQPELLQINAHCENKTAR